MQRSKDRNIPNKYIWPGTFFSPPTNQSQHIGQPLSVSLVCIFILAVVGWGDRPLLSNHIAGIRYQHKGPEHKLLTLQVVYLCKDIQLIDSCNEADPTNQQNWGYHNNIYMSTLNIHMLLLFKKKSLLCLMSLLLLLCVMTLLADIRLESLEWIVSRLYFCVYPLIAKDNNYSPHWSIDCFTCIQQ